MAFTDEDSVGGIIEWDTSIDLTPFIDTAHYCILKAVTDSSYTDADKEIIERWLAAHFYAVRDPRAIKESAGSVTVTYQGKVGLGFDVTEYGQQAMRLDIKGGLAQMNEGASSGDYARIFQILYVGTNEEYSEDYDYDVSE